MKEDGQKLTSKNQVDNALDIALKCSGKIFKKLERFDLSYFNNRKYFGDDIS